MVLWVTVRLEVEKGTVVKVENARLICGIIMAIHATNELLKRG